MQFTGAAGEFLRISTVTEANQSLLTTPVREGLAIVWNLEGPTSLRIDGQPCELSDSHLVFLTEFHRVTVRNLGQVRLLQFNRPFYCVVDHDAEVGCKGLLFFGASSVPLVQIPTDERENFCFLWRTFESEMQTKDDFQFQMLQLLLKRLLILSTRLFKNQRETAGFDRDTQEMFREFNFLVEMHYKTLHSVAAYADLLNKSPKTLSNRFAQYHRQSPLQTIQNRILLEARRLLLYTEAPVKEISYQTGFEDIQSFSRFFKSKEGISPREFREKRYLVESPEG